MVKYEEKTLSVNGVQTSYFDEGSNEEPVVLFLHGWGESKEVFDGIIEKLDQFYRIILLDLPGHGGTESLEKGTIVNYADFVGDFVSEIGLSEVSIVGFSMGGVIALMCNTMFPELVDKIVVWESSVDFRGIKRLRSMNLLFRLLQQNPSWRDRLYSAINNKYISELLSKVVTPSKIEALKNADPRAIVEVGQDLVNSDLRGDIIETKKDALLISGVRTDILIPKRKIGEIRRVLPESMVKEIKGAEHFSRDFSNVYDEILNFLQNNNEKA